MMNTGDIKVNDATHSAAETIALLRADEQEVMKKLHAEHAKQQAQHQSRLEEVGHPYAVLQQASLPSEPHPITVEGIYAEALAVGMRHLLQQAAQPHYPHMLGACVPQGYHGLR